jgi:hypothetical protein
MVEGIELHNVCIFERADALINAESNILIFAMARRLKPLWSL